MLTRTIALLLMAAITSIHLSAQDEVLEGHSAHGEAFNEGPRQAAVLMEGCGNVHFEVSTRSERAQRFFDQGMGQLHGFWYFESERSFRQVAALDPECAMAYWGMAMANVDNEERAAGLAVEAWRRIDSVTPRERLYIESIARFYEVDKTTTGRAPAPWPQVFAKFTPKKRKRDRNQEIRRRRRYVQDLEKVVQQFDDVEAKALLVNQLWLDTRKGVPIHSRQANQALLDQVFAANPKHPALHYRIHLWDTKETAALAVDAAATSGQAAPSIAHMWHMGGHIFDRLYRYADSAWQQEASARVDHAHMMRHGVMPFQIHNYAHNNEWCTRSLRAVGRVGDAIALAKNMIELPRHPELNRLDKGGSGARYGRQRLLETLAMYEMWEQTLALGATMYIESGAEPRTMAERSFALSRAALMLRREDEAAKHRSEILDSIEDLREKRAAALDEAETKAVADKKNDADIDKAMAAAMKPHTRNLRRTERELKQLDALAGWNEKQDVAVIKDAGLDEATRIRLHVAAGDMKTANNLADKFVERGSMRAVPLATQAWVRWKSGKQDAAKESFDKLRAISARFDLEARPFARLSELAREFGHDADWRVPNAVADDIGVRPDLEGLGPFRWSPVTAKGFKLPGGRGDDIALSGYAGKPVLVVFFLGFGCVHCVEQLTALKPMADRFRQAGISIVTVGNQSVDEVMASIDKRPMPFPIACDPKHEVFKRYRCFDDFEGVPLHGTFLVDGDGFVRWQDISYEPFMETEFLLAECERLLALPVKTTVARRLR